MIYFKEEQRFRQWWLLAIVIISSISILIIFSYGFYKQFYLEEPWGDTPMSDQLLLILAPITIVIVFAVTWGTLFAKLETEIKDFAVYYRFIPFVWSRKKIRAEDINYFEVRKYSPVGEYGGWGYHFSFGNGRAVNVGGNMGLQLILKNGKKLLIGTQKPEEIRKVMQQMIDKMQEDYG